MHILATLPVGVWTPERSFSILRRLTMWLLSRMTEHRLNSLTLMHIHRDIFIDIDKVKIDLRKIRTEDLLCNLLNIYVLFIDDF